jgi:oligoendopeptidase F
MRTSYADIADELASIVSRMVPLMEFVTTGLNDTPDAEEVLKRLRRMKKHKQAKELEKLFARAEELRSASPDSSYATISDRPWSS